MKKPNQLCGFLLGMLTMALLMGLLVPAIATSVSKTITVSGDLSIFVDGVEMKPTDASGNPVDVFLYNGTTYVPIRAVSQYLGKAVKWDRNTRSVYIGETPGAKQYLLSVCPPYEKRGYNAPAIISMAGQKNANGFTLYQGSGGGFALFNLNGQYNALSFDLGHVDGGPLYDSTLNIYLDGELAFSTDMTREMLPKHFDIPLHSASQMKIETGSWGQGYAIANVELY